MKDKFIYHCLECNQIIYSGNTPKETPFECWDCTHKHIAKMAKRRTEKLNVNFDERKRKKEELKIKNAKKAKKYSKK